MALAIQFAWTTTAGRGNRPLASRNGSFPCTAARHSQPLGAAGEVELAAQRTLVGAQGDLGLHGNRLGLLTRGEAALAIADAGTGFHCASE